MLPDKSGVRALDLGEIATHVILDRVGAASGVVVVAVVVAARTAAEAPGQVLLRARGDEQR